MMVFWAYVWSTDHVWEDFFITFKFSENLASGRGLVYGPGQAAHGFTSPIGTLLPAVFHLLAGSPEANPWPALWMFRGVSSLALATAVGIVYVALRRSTRHATFAMLGSILLLLDAKSVVFAASGMESAFMALFCAVMLLSISLETRRAMWCMVVAFAGLQLTRPDGVVYSAAFVIALWLVDRRKWLLTSLRAAALAVLIYMPWFVFAWTYYGSPIPNTARAKAATLIFEPRFDPALSWYANIQALCSRALDIAQQLFMPAMAGFGGWPNWLWWWATMAAGLAVVMPVYFLIARQSRQSLSHTSVIAGLVTVFAIVYFVFAPGPSAWYLPHVTLMAIASMTGLLSYAALRHRKLAIATVMFMVFVQAIGLVQSTRQLAVQQKLIETATRTEIGRWLNQHTPPDATIFLECLGYVGYHARRPMFDYPGLARPEVWHQIRARRLRFRRLAEHFQCDYMVLRPVEWQQIRAMSNGFAERYEKVYEVNRLAEVEALPASIWGKDYLRHDAAFVVLRRVR